MDRSFTWMTFGWSILGEEGRLLIFLPPRHQGTKGHKAFVRRLVHSLCFCASYVCGTVERVERGEKVEWVEQTASYILSVLVPRMFVEQLMKKWKELNQAKPLSEPWCFSVFVAKKKRKPQRLVPRMFAELLKEWKGVKKWNGLNKPLRAFLVSWCLVCLWNS